MWLADRLSGWARRIGWKRHRLARARKLRRHARAICERRKRSRCTRWYRTLARQNLDVVRQTFGLGRGTVFDVLAEQRRYLDFEQAYTAALAEAWDARASLKRALGDTK